MSTTVTTTLLPTTITTINTHQKKHVDLHNDSDLCATPKQEINIFGFNLSKSSPNTIVSAYTLGIFVIYITIFIIQESIFKKSHFNFGGLITFLQFATYAIYALIHRRYVPKLAHERRAPLSFYFSMGFYSVAGTAASCYSLSLLNFPTWVLFKSSRVVGVMIAGIFMLKKRYQLKEYIGVMLLAFGLVIFTLGDISLLPKFNPLGILLVFISLTMNSLEGNLQEKGLTHYRASENEMVIYAYGIGALQLLPFLLWNGEFVGGMSALKENPYVILQLIVLCSLGYYGILLVLGLCKISSALTTVIVTSCRKALTVVFSFIVFAKPFSVFYIFGFSTFFLGVFLNVYTKNKDQIDSLAQQVLQMIVPKKATTKALPIVTPSERQHLIVAETAPVCLSPPMSPCHSPLLKMDMTRLTKETSSNSSKRLRNSTTLSSSGGLSKRRPIDTVTIIVKAAA